MTETYRKVVLQAHGRTPQNILKIVEVPLTDPAPNEVLIKNHYAGVNYSDIALMLGLSPASQRLPQDFGVESAGEIVAVGADVDAFSVGDFVLTALPGNGFREYTRVAANLAHRVPALKPEYIGLYVSGAMAKIALDYIISREQRQTMMVTAGLASVGHYAVQLAKLAGHYVIATCGSTDEEELLHELGADRVIVRSEEDVAQVLHDEFRQALDIVFDAYGGAIFDACLDNMAVGGLLMSGEVLHEHLGDYGYLHRVDLYNQLTHRSVILRGINFRDYAHYIHVEGAKMLDLFERGEIRTVLDPRSFEGIESVPDALAYLMSGAGRGKLFVKVNS